MAEERYPIGVVARRTGLSKDVLRVWESRYAVVSPARSESGRRLYSEEDVERLALLRQATSGGWSIGEVAGRSTEELRDLVIPTRATVAVRDGGAVPDELVAECLAAIDVMSAGRLEATLSRAIVELPATVLLDDVVTKLLEEIGNRWQSGILDPGQEHLASMAVRTALARVISDIQPGDSAPGILVATPTGEDHELGAMMAAAAAASSGWRTIYIGVDLPAEDIAAAVRRTRTEAIGLSLVAANGKSSLARVSAQLDRLRDEVGPGVKIFLGGRAAASHADVAARIGAERLSDLPAFRARLESLAS
ncbi:MAG: MerR family transcriptional regulator [Planctomycetota bacterium]|jgi:methanogenic corrinoid protein MtbC1